MMDVVNLSRWVRPLESINLQRSFKKDKKINGSRVSRPQGAVLDYDFNKIIMSKIKSHTLTNPQHFIDH